MTKENENLREKYLNRIKQLQDELFSLGITRDSFDPEMPIDELLKFGIETADQLKNRKRFLGKK